MRYEVNECCDCANDTYPCIGDSCSLLHTVKYYCDDCGADDLTEDEIHHIDGVDLCHDCYNNDYNFDEGGELVDNCTDASNPDRKENENE